MSVAPAAPACWHDGRARHPHPHCAEALTKKQSPTPLGRFGRAGPQALRVCPRASWVTVLATRLPCDRAHNGAVTLAAGRRSAQGTSPYRQAGVMGVPGSCGGHWKPGCGCFLASCWGCHCDWWWVVQSASPGVLPALPLLTPGYAPPLQANAHVTVRAGRACD
jgi:hypothetical protein